MHARSGRPTGSDVPHPDLHTLIDLSSELVGVTVDADGFWTVEVDAATTSTSPDDAGAIVWWREAKDTGTGELLTGFDKVGTASLGQAGHCGIPAVVLDTAPDTSSDLWVVVGIGVVDTGVVTWHQACGMVFTGGYHRTTTMSDGAASDDAVTTTALAVAVGANNANRPSCQGFDGTGFETPDRTSFSHSSDSSFIRAALPDKVVQFVAVGIRNTGANQTIKFKPFHRVTLLSMENLA